MQQKFDAVLFDFDGTLVDSGEGIRNGLNFAFTQVGIPTLGADELADFIGPPIRESLVRFRSLSGDTLDAAVAHYRAHYSESGIAQFSLYPGVTETLAFLRERGIACAVASSKPQRFLEQVLRLARLNGLFAVCCGSESDQAMETKAVIIRRALGKLSLYAPYRTLMVGDRYFDIQGAKQVGLPAAGVLFGYGSETELREAGADWLLPAMPDLRNIVTNS